jgi:dTDP-4-amino-4,6-dideoxygalactose transaminase
MGKLIPFYVPHVPEESKKYALEALAGNHQQGDGPFTVKASKSISRLVGGGHVLLTPSCTHALEMASMLANIGPGDEVILPSYTFTSAATAVTKFGATPIFVDIEMRTKGIDVNQVYESISPKTKAISWVNYAGVAPDIDGLQSIAREFNLILIEDNAHGLGGSHRGKPLGSFGDFAAQSFHATKNIQCGEGGALVVNNPKFIERAEVIREKGTNRSRYVRGEVNKYEWMDQGSSYLLAEVLSAILYGQLENFQEIQENRRHSIDLYHELFYSKSPSFESQNISQTYHMFYLTLLNTRDREHLRSLLRKKNVFAASHYQSLVESFHFKSKYESNLIHPLAHNFSSKMLRLPLWTGMGSDSIEQTVNEVLRSSIQLQNG